MYLILCKTSNFSLNIEHWIPAKRPYSINKQNWNTLGANQSQENDPIFLTFEFNWYKSKNNGSFEAGRPLKVVKEKRENKTFIYICLFSHSFLKSLLLIYKDDFFPYIPTFLLKLPTIQDARMPKKCGLWLYATQQPIMQYWNIL